MKIVLFRLSLAAGLLLPLPMLGQAQSSNRVSQEAFNPKAPVPEHPSQMYIARLVEYSVGIFRKHHEAGAVTGLPDGFHYYIRQWQQQDVTNFAGCRETFDGFENLLGVGNLALDATPQGKYTADAIEAQQALTYLKPDCCKSWKGFFNMIMEAAKKTQATRDYYRKLVKH